jgi:hypothetical protein
LRRKAKPEEKRDRATEKKKEDSWALVAHACNPSYFRGRDQEDRGSKAALANSS